VVLSDDELKEAASEKSAAIEIQEFVNESQIPTLYFEKQWLPRRVDRVARLFRVPAHRCGKASEV
jgi:non-homologous end joining protein Ku